MLSLDEIIGRGGFGTVYRGTLRTDDGLTRRVAVKVLSDELSEDPMAVSRLRDEARLLALLDHPALVPVFALQPLDDRWSVVMGLVEGVDLRSLMRRTGQVPPRVVAELGLEVADALGAIYRQTHPQTGEPLAVVHRDIKPQNLMVDTTGRVRLLDFGVASARFAAREAQTRGGVAGTLAYMSPQRWNREDDRHKGDIYALAATLYHAVTGTLPPEAASNADDHGARMAAAMEALPPGAQALKPALLAGLSADETARPDGPRLAELLSDALSALEGPDLRSWARVLVSDLLEDRQSGNDALTSLSGSSWDLMPLTTGGGLADDPLETGWIFTDDPEPEAEVGNPRLVWLGVGLAVALVAGAVGWFAPRVLGPAAPSGPPLVMLVPPVHPEALMQEAMAPLVDHLQAALDRPVALRVAGSYGDTLVLHRSGEADLTLMTPLLYVQALADGVAEPLAMTDPVVMSGHEGVLLVARDVADLDGLRGQTVCFTDPNSTSGFLLPRRYLRKNGMVPGEDFEARISGGHSQAVADLAAGKCKAAGTFMNAFADAAQRDETNGAQVYARTGLAAHNTMACGPESDCGGVADALLAFHPGEAGSDAFRINGFVEHDPAVFADLVEAWAAENPR